METQSAERKWQGSVCGIVEAPIDKVWRIVSESKRLSQWMQMVETCSDVAGEEGIAGYTRLVSGYMFPQDDGDRSWMKERLVSMDCSAHSYTYKMEATNVGLDGCVNTVKLVEYGDGSTLVRWGYELEPVEGGCEDTIIDYLGFLYRSCVSRIKSAVDEAHRDDDDDDDDDELEFEIV